MPRKKIYTEKEYRGYEIIDWRREQSKKKNVRAFYEKDIEAIYRLGMQALESKELTQPTAYMYTFSFTPEHQDYSISKLMEQISDLYQEPKKGKEVTNQETGEVETKGSRKPENTFKPLYFWCREKSESKTHPLKDKVHYHLMLILDEKKGRIGAARYLFGRLKKKGIIETATVSKDMDAEGFIANGRELKADAKCKLKKEDEFARYMYWFSYLAKVETRLIEIGKRSSGHSVLSKIS